MFFEGDLRAGIAQSLSQNKVLTCFIADEEQERSKLWEKSLQEHAEEILSKAVVLKFTPESEEAGYLRTFCPVERVPTVVVIRFGAVLGKLETPLSPENMVSRLMLALMACEKAASQPTPEPEQAQQQEPGAEDENITEETHDSVPGNLDPTTAASASEPAQPVDRPTEPGVKGKGKQKSVEDDKAARIARSEARRKEAEAAIAATASGKGRDVLDAKEVGRNEVRAEWIKQQAKRKEQLAKDRERILQSIESDRQERRHRTVSKKENVAASEPMRASRQSSVVSSQGCNLQVRLPQGNSIRQGFEASDTLSGAVRDWIKVTAPADSAKGIYTFRLLRPPQPSLNIDVEDEQKSLAELGMTPSATLVLVERHGGNDMNDGSMIGKLMAMLNAVLASIIGFISYFLGTVNTPPSTAQTDSNTTTQKLPAASEASTSTGTEARAGNVKLRTGTLADSRARDRDTDEPTQFYNGNSSAFESRKDDDPL